MEYPYKHYTIVCCYSDEFPWKYIENVKYLFNILRVQYVYYYVSEYFIIFVFKVTLMILLVSNVLKKKDIYLTI